MYIELTLTALKKLEKCKYLIGKIFKIEFVLIWLAVKLNT